jgi:hypothetical protein
LHSQGQQKYKQHKSLQGKYNNPLASNCVFQRTPLTHEKVEENKEKKKGKENTHTLQHPKKIHFNILCIYFIDLFNFNKTTFYKQCYFNTLSVILVLNIKTMHNLIRS